ncbi:filamentous hemagglutinin [Mycobacterium antarcticum]|uniref:NAD(P)/FAD-dependent oxidoreductase n=1 Tax=Mycolicibacterium sp. TUM20985 TaxID=3023370 RepID=UPI00257296AF|nr:FAD/NAD(P)-binding oxidoreductase [Mycolicibacterium sp. TUM20985]BDX35077.1 filamentous hemagglutinin [Mycolicibacterium sp. TUM20985]
MDSSAVDASFDVLVIGGGNAGISAAARLLRKGIHNVAVIEPQTIHTYRPLLSYVGGGQATMASAERTQRSVTPKGCTWLMDTAVDVDAVARVVRCASGREYRYRDLIVATGLVPDTEALPGIARALDDPAVASNYLDAADKTWKVLQRMPVDGRAIFTVPRAPVSCTGTTIKPLFLAAEHWKRTGRSTGVAITLVVDRDRLSDAPDLDARLRNLLGELGVQVLYQTGVTGLFPDERSITVTDRGDGTVRRLSYDMLHLVPPFRGPEWVTSSGLAADGSFGLADVDPGTFQHRAHPHVWAAGDGATVDTDPSGGALRRQIAILVDNLLAVRTGGHTTAYDGYTVAPITTDAHRLILGEFDRSGALASALPSPLDPLKPRRTAWAFDRYGLPQIYWKLILNGRL